MNLVLHELKNNIKNHIMLHEEKYENTNYYLLDTIPY